MSAGWVAGSVRAKALVRRRLGAESTRRLAACGSLGDALRLLAATPYGANIRHDQSLAAAQHEVAGTLLWDLRVLAGWLPRDGVRLLRTLGAWFELANVDELLQSMAGRPAEAEFRLGALATAWPRLRQAASTSELRAALAASAWQDPGRETVQALRLGLRARWAERVAELGDPARTWAAAAAAAQVRAGSPSSATRSAQRARRPRRSACTVSRPGSCQAEAASAARSSLVLAAWRSRGQAVASAPSRNSASAGRPAMDWSSSSTLASSNQAPRVRSSRTPSLGSQPASTRRSHSRVPATSCCAAARDWSWRMFAP